MKVVLQNLTKCFPSRTKKGADVIAVKDGKAVLGNSGSCVASYVIPTAGAKLWAWPWGPP